MRYVALLCLLGCTSGTAPIHDPCERPDTVPADSLVFELKAAEQRCVVVRYRGDV